VKKPDSLRAAIVAANSSLETDPDQLAVFIDKGKLAARYGAGLSFEYRYRCIIIVTNFAGDGNQILFPVLLWLRDNQRELLLNHTDGDQAFTYEVVVLGEKLIDLEVRLDLTEAVDVEPREGGFELVYRPEPPIDATFEDVPLGALAGEIWANGELVCRHGEAGPELG
jgi:hypothetical protein